MANSNFVVHNGLTVGPLTIFAGNGDISTAGNITSPGLSSSSITKNDTSISINDTGSGSSVVITIDGVTEQTIDADGVKLPSGDAYYINNLSVLDATTLGSGVVNSSLTTVGILTGLKASGNIVAGSGTASTSATTGALVVQGGAGVSGNVQSDRVYVTTGVYWSGNGAAFSSAPGGVTGDIQFNDNQLFAAANIKFDKTNGNLVITSQQTSTSTTTGALVVSGGMGISGNVFTSEWIVPTANTTQNLGTTNNWWGTFYGISTQAKYADLAENYQADAPYEPGTVLEFGGGYELTLADDGSKRVAGVVSTNPAHLMNGMLRGPNVVPLALQGRTPCRVRGKISKGDMLISGGSGYARPDNNPILGTVIGKALEDFNGIEGVIEVVVGRL